MAWQRQKAGNEAQCDSQHVAGDTGSRVYSGNLGCTAVREPNAEELTILMIAVLRMNHQSRFALHGPAKDREINAEECLNCF